MYRLYITGDIGFEFWMDIPGWEDCYQASTYGRIRSKDRTDSLGRRHTGKVLSLYIYNGYYGVRLKNGKQQETCSVHRLVAQTFLPNQEGKKYVDHKDTDSLNSRVENLRWCTAKENCNNPITVEHYKKGKDSVKKQVYAYDKNLCLIGIYESIHEASRQTGYDVRWIWSSMNRNTGKTFRKILFRSEPIPSA